MLSCLYFVLGFFNTLEVKTVTECDNLSGFGVKLRNIFACLFNDLYVCVEYAVDLLYSFVNCSGLELIFGLNALLRTPDNVWNSQNAELLLNYCERQQYRMSWELGNGATLCVCFCSDLCIRNITVFIGSVVTV